MKIYTTFWVSLFMLFGSLNVEAQSPSLAAGAYTIASDSQIKFTATNFIFVSVPGRFTDFTGDIKLNEPFSSSEVQISIATKSIDTDNKSRDHHLCTADYFNCEKYPKMTFVSKSVRGGPESFDLDGELTIADVTQPVTLHGQLTKNAGNDLSFSAKTNVSRRKFKLTNGSTISDDIKIELNVHLSKTASVAQ